MLHLFKDYGVGGASSDKCISTGDKDPLSQTILQLFSPPSSVGYSFGVDSLPVEFYSDLFDLLSEIGWEDINMYVNIIGYPGTYSSYATLTKKGFEWEVNFYDENSDDEDW